MRCCVEPGGQWGAGFGGLCGLEFGRWGPVKGWGAGSWGQTPRDTHTGRRRPAAGTCIGGRALHAPGGPWSAQVRAGHLASSGPRRRLSDRSTSARPHGKSKPEGEVRVLQEVETLLGAGRRALGARGSGWGELCWTCACSLSGSFAAAVLRVPQTATSMLVQGGGRGARRELGHRQAGCPARTATRSRD